MAKRAITAIFFFILAIACTRVTSVRLNGWYACGTPSVSKGVALPAPSFECAMVTMPLCHPGVCTSNQTIEVFVKRLLPSPASTVQAARARSMWALQGGPGVSSSNMESQLTAMWEATNGSIHAYTLDVRGAGRSTFLDCEAAQAQTAASPASTRIAPEEFSSCFRDLLFKYDNQMVAFSTTSAALDLAFLIKELTGDTDAYVYGASYGTYWAQRLMHVAPSNVKGYILDGVVSTKSYRFSSWNDNIVAPTKRLIDACANDTFCKSKFAPLLQATNGSLEKAFQTILTKLDSAAPGKNPCADFFRSQIGAGIKVPVSTQLRYVLEWRARGNTRVFVPAFLYRASRCNTQDLAFLKKYANYNFAPAKVIDKIKDRSELLFKLVKFSELWAIPETPLSTHRARDNSSILRYNLTEETIEYCLYSGRHEEPACQEATARVAQPYYNTTPRLTYDVDQYHGKTATLPNGVSVLLINGRLDMNTPAEFGEEQFATYNTTNKLLLQFKYGGHCTGMAGTTDQDHTKCTDKIMASFLLNDGQTSKVESGCMKNLPPLEFHNKNSVARLFSKMTDVYEGNVSTTA
ncbi:TPA: hypothetical protein N0F65_001356 [Lagenidium giganteum]|uniref:AB hydrolase-1 domain-containing protein n=1 Tax=Lagenidium giganteum TaxID=4803 RepID=A0AAV2YV55_9STRA|nr:TPA: hypothetical protein N0F65_001356 [Lagenidium giganteum]